MAEQHRATIDLSHLSDAEREKMARWIANPGRFEVLEVAQPAKPDSSLVERVEDAIHRNWNESGHGFREEARAAIREVAAWLREQSPFGVGGPMRLEREAEHFS